MKYLGDAHLLEVVVRDVAEDLKVNLVLLERLRNISKKRS